jgi:ubiquinone/menaquinone biosynthesis C-methylase UbiE
MISNQQYDQIGKGYSVKINSTKAYTRLPTILKMTGSIKGKDVLDIACGDGYITRQLSEYNPKSLHGIDISPVMIDLAQKQEKVNPKGIQYAVGNALNLHRKNMFDIVTAVYLLDYARNKIELTKMCKSIFTSLKQGGIFAAITISPKLIPHELYINGWKTINPSGKKYFSDGDEINLISDLTNGPQIIIRCYYWSERTYKSCLELSGFRQVKFNYRLSISKEGKEKYSASYWKEIQSTTGGVSIFAVK